MSRSGGAARGEEQILRVHEALDALGKVDARMAQVVEMRYFGGLTELEMAAGARGHRPHGASRLGAGAAVSRRGAEVGPSNAAGAMNSNFDLAPEQWASLRQLLDRALDLPPAERNAWVDRLDPHHAELVPRLRALLAHAETPALEQALGTLPRVETAAFACTGPATRPGSRRRNASVPTACCACSAKAAWASVWLAERTDMLQADRSR